MRDGLALKWASAPTMRTGPWSGSSTVITARLWTI